MLIIVSGGSGSGKSKYAEDIALKLKNKYACNNIIYIATMKPYGDEALERIARHRNMRRDKGFETVECFSNLKNINIGGDSVVLVECMSNLVANEIFDKKNKNAVSDITQGINRLVSLTKAVVVVTNDVFSDGVSYDEDTEHYIKTLAEINNIMAESADSITEVVCGIPIYIKGGAIN